MNFIDEIYAKIYTRLEKKTVTEEPRKYPLHKVTIAGMEFDSPTGWVTPIDTTCRIMEEENGTN